MEKQETKRALRGIKSGRAAGRPIRADYAEAADFLRAACILLIGWYHIWQQSWLNPNLTIGRVTIRLYPVVAGGYEFVDLMLMLSGFLLMLGHLSGRGRRAGEFYLNRAARILPSYGFCLAVALTAAIFDGVYASFGAALRDLLPHLGFVHNLFPASYIHTHLNGVMWTLAVEAQFYLIFPPLARAFRKRPLRVWAAMTLIAFAFRGGVALLAVPAGRENMLINQLPAMLDGYANGMLAALLYVRLAERPRRAGGAAISTVVCLAAAAAIYYICVRQTRLSGRDALHLGQLLYRWPLTLAGAAFLLFGSRAAGALRALLSNRLTRALCAISFNFYLWHQFLAVKLKLWHLPPYSGTRPNADGNLAWQNGYTALCFLAALLAAVGATYLIERPCARAIRARMKRRAGRRGDAARKKRTAG